MLVCVLQGLGALFFYSFSLASFSTGKTINPDGMLDQPEPMKNNSGGPKRLEKKKNEENKNFTPTVPTTHGFHTSDRAWRESPDEHKCKCTILVCMTLGNVIVFMLFTVISVSSCFIINIQQYIQTILQMSFFFFFNAQNNEKINDFACILIIIANC